MGSRSSCCDHTWPDPKWENQKLTCDISGNLLCVFVFNQKSVDLKPSFLLLSITTRQVVPLENYTVHLLTELIDQCSVEPRRIISVAFGP